MSLLTLTVGPIAHGGHCVARHEGRVIFVRHTLPGEVVRARRTGGEPGARYWRADAIEVLEPSPDRVPSVWPEAGPGGVGGAEFAHVALPAQRELKARVIVEQLRRLAGLEVPVTVQAVPGESDGLAWRTRIDLTVNDEGRAGMHRYRSDEVVALTGMPLASAQIHELGLFGRRWPAGARVSVVAPVGGDRVLVLVDGVPWSGQGLDRRPNARTSVRERADVAGRGYVWRVAGDGFWQVHRAAPTVLAGAVMDAVGALEGGTVLDLYSGAGLFTLPLADAVGRSGRVVAVEGSPGGVRDARRNTHDRPQVELHRGSVADVLGENVVAHADVAVLDPPRVGAGRVVVERVVGCGADRVVYVACDPAALARDVRYLGEQGYVLSDLKAFDVFPMTHHVECVATFVRE